MTSVASQAQLTVVDTYLTKDPSLSLFTPTNRTYTPLAQDYVFHRPETQISGLPGESVRFSLRRTGDLLSNLYLRFRGAPLSEIYPADGRGSVLGTVEAGSDNEDQRARFKWGPLAYHVIDSVTLSLNSTVIDSLYGDWMYVWSECLTPTANRAEGKTLATKMMTPDINMQECDNEFFFIPIPFWFTQHPSLALPLVALANTEIGITVTFARTVNNIPILNTIGSDDQVVYSNRAMNTGVLQSMELVTLETTLCEAERRWFATNPSSYLITQHNQRYEHPYSLTKSDRNSNPSYAPNATTTAFVNDPDEVIPLDAFRLPIKQLWVGRGGLQCQTSETAAPNAVTFMTDNRLLTGCFYQESYILNDAREITDRATIRQRFSLPFYQDGKHIGISSSIKKQLLGVAGQTMDADNENTMANQPSLISFNLELDDIYPHGAINFSRLKSPRLVLKGAKMEAFPSTLRDAYEQVQGNYVVLSENYNVLDIRDGTAYLRFTD